MACRSAGFTVLLGLAACGPGIDSGSEPVDTGMVTPLLEVDDATPSVEGPTFAIDRWATTFRFGTTGGSLTSLGGLSAELELLMFSEADFPEGPELDELSSETRICSCTVLLEGAQLALSAEPASLGAWTLTVDAESAQICSGDCNLADAAALGGDVETWWQDRTWTVELLPLSTAHRAEAAARFRDWDTWQGAAVGARVVHSGADGLVHSGEELLVLASEVAAGELVLDSSGQAVPAQLSEPVALRDAAWLGLPVAMAVPFTESAPTTTPDRGVW